MNKQYWVITVGGGYGGFLFQGTREEAEEMRRHKARWEQALAHKRRATPAEVQANVVDHSLPASEFLQAGDVWRSPRGSLYRVIGPNGETDQMVLRKGLGGSGRKQYRSRDNVLGWALQPTI